MWVYTVCTQPFVCGCGCGCECGWVGGWVGDALGHYKGVFIVHSCQSCVHVWYTLSYLWVYIVCTLPFMCVC